MALQQLKSSASTRSSSNHHWLFCLINLSGLLPLNLSRLPQSMVTICSVGLSHLDLSRNAFSFYVVIARMLLAHHLSWFFAAV